MSEGQAEQTAVEAGEPEAEIEASEGEIEQGEAEGGKPPQTASEVDELAREMGWAPKSEWRGPPESWKSAKDYIRHGTVIQRDLKSRNDAQTREFQERIERLDRSHQKTLERQRNQIEETWRGRMREAVRLGDEQAFDAASRGRDAELQKFDDELVSQPAKANGTPPELPAEIHDFAQRNIWFNKDKAMTHAAVGISQDLLQQYPGMPLTERLSMVETQIRSEFPHKFGPGSNGNGAKPPAVEGGLRPIRTSTKKGWDSLPGEAKQAGTRFVAQGLYKTKDEYAEQYWAQEQ